MTKRTLSWAVVASMAVGGVAVAQQSPSDRAGQSQPGQQSSQTGLSGRSTDLQQGGQGAERQLSQTLQQIKQDPKTAGDKLFLLHTAIGNQYEIQLAQKAQSKSQDQQVKQVAQKIEQDHTEAGRKLQEVAQKIGLQVPQSLPMMKQQELEIFNAMEGEDFDKAFISHMQVAHAKDVTAFHNKSQTAKNEDVKRFASETLPKLQKHMHDIEQSATALGLPSGTEAVTAGARMGASDSDRSLQRDRSGRTGDTSDRNR